MIVNSTHKVLLLIVLVLSVSCQDVQKTEKPDDLIPEAKMIDVLTELSLVHAARNYNRAKLENTGITPDTYIYQKFDIDSMQFKRSAAYYSEQYTDFERMYDSVKNRIQRMKTRLDSLREIEVRIEDSIKLAKKDSLRALDSLGVDFDSIDLDLERRRDLKDSLISPPTFDSETSREGYN